mmetsp:Transcript_1651/g.4185  ORF Transcript_1651/g.4185 Transcript_1651/m.4185 type:complete len:237 (+) Transcript_1651:666-1376(+)
MLATEIGDGVTPRETRRRTEVHNRGACRVGVLHGGGDRESRVCCQAPAAKGDTALGHNFHVFVEASVGHAANLDHVVEVKAHITAHGDFSVAGIDRLHEDCCSARCGGHGHGGCRGGSLARRGLCFARRCLRRHCGCGSKPRRRCLSHGCHGGCGGCLRNCSGGCHRDRGRCISGRCHRNGGLGLRRGRHRCRGGRRRCHGCGRRGSKRGRSRGGGGNLAGNINIITNTKAAAKSV